MAMFSVFNLDFCSKSMSSSSFLLASVPGKSTARKNSLNLQQNAISVNPAVADNMDVNMHCGITWRAIVHRCEVGH